MKRAPVRHAVEHALFLPFVGLLRTLPHEGSRRVGRALGALAHAVDRGHRRVAADNVARALPGLDVAARRRIVAGCFRHFGETFADALSSGRFDLPEFCRRGEVHGLQNLAAAAAPGRGFVVLASHYGTWEVLPAYLAQANHPLALVGRPADNPHFDRVIRRLRERFGNRALDKRGSVRTLFRVLGDGGAVGLLIDQRVRAEEAIDVPFFGRPALTSPIVARLALRTGAPVLPVFGDLEPRGRYRVRILPPLWPEGRDDDHTTVELTTRALSVCETVIREAPERWLWLHRRWKRP